MLIFLRWLQTKSLITLFSISSVSLLCVMSFSLNAQSIQPSLDCTEGIIVINGQVVGSGMWCTWVYTPQYEVGDYGVDDPTLPSGAIQVSTACYNHRQTIDSLPAICRFLDTDKPPNFNWSAHFLPEFKSMLCQVTSCTDPANYRGPFRSRASDNMALQILNAVGSAYWLQYSAESMIPAVRPIIDAQCSRFPPFSFWGYDQGECYQDAVDLARELSPTIYTPMFNWLNSISVHGINFNPSPANPNFGMRFLQKISNFRRCADWQDRLDELCS